MARICKAPSCSDRFEPQYNSMQPTCGKIPCAIEYAESRRGQDDIRKARNREVRQAKREIRENSLSWWKTVNHSDASRNGGNVPYWLHRWITKVRDKDKPCIMCGATEPRGGQWHACHFRSRGAANHLRFEPDNIHKGCAHCNTYTTGDTASKYRANLIERIGLDRVEALETNNETHHWTIDECRAIRDDYKQRCKAAGV